MKWSEFARTTPPEGFRQKELDWADPDLHPLVIYAWLEAFYGGWLDWEPETVTETLLLEGKDLPAVKLNQEKVLAFPAVINTRAFQEFQIYENVAHVFNGEQPLFATVQPNSPGALVVCNRICKSVMPDVEWSKEVQSYMAACLKNTGFLVVPEALRFPGVLRSFGAEFNAQDILSRKKELAEGRKPDDSVEDNQALLLLSVEDYVILDDDRLRKQEQIYFG